MKVLWDGSLIYGRGMTLGEIAAELADTTDWSTTTIRTLVIRLSEKGAVSVDKTSGIYKYKAVALKSECIKSEIESFLKRVFDNSAYNLISSLVKQGKITEKEKKDIIAILSDIEENE